METLEFVKMHAVGNDFIMINAISLPDTDWPAAARRLCPWHFGIGSDGLMVIQESRKGGYRARMFNPDGTEDMCGNGMLCSGVFLHDEGLVGTNEFEIESLAGWKHIRLRIELGRAVQATINMGPALFEPRAIPAQFEGDTVLERKLEVEGDVFTISSVSTGTPHTIVFSDRLPDDDYFMKWAPRIEMHPVFPEKTSVTWAVIDSTKQARTRIWERGGVGESLACGTGACALAAVGHRLGLTAKSVAISSKGGELLAELDETDNAWLTGRPERVFEGRITYPLAGNR